MWRRLLHLLHLTRLFHLSRWLHWLQWRGTARSIWLLCTIGTMLAGLGLAQLDKLITRPRVWQPQETATAFWAWRDALPSAETVAEAQRSAGMQTLFVRAGQFDFNPTTNSPQRIRAVSGAWPSSAASATGTTGVALHLTYNATKDLLAKLETIDAQRFAEEILSVWQTDAAQAQAQSVNNKQVVGLQLDIDAPTRLLSNYAVLLRAVRARLPAGVQLSITGLPTWMTAKSLKDLSEVLATVDFWIPQFYGGRIPANLSEMQPISVPDDVSRETSRARELGRPFYAGLAAYGYALRYDSSGHLTEVRGDVNPSLIAADSRWQLISRQQFTNKSNNTPAGTWRYVFQARAAGANSSLAWTKDENLVLEIPSVESLRQAARAARTEGGPQMLGLCIFRLPDSTDPTTLKLSQIVAALRDTEVTEVTPAPPNFTKNWQVQETAAPETTNNSLSAGRVWRWEVTNNGTLDAPLGDGALIVTLFVPPGQAHLLERGDWRTVQALCGANGANGANSEAAQPCNPRRANILRFIAHAWPVGAKYSLALSVPTDARPDAWQMTVRSHE